MKIPKKPLIFLRSGFSLVEVTIAVAIAALGFATLMGLLPAGINMAKDAAQMSTGARIIQKLTGEMQSAAWEDIDWTGYSPLRYFTVEGSEITASETTDPDQLALQLAYVASVQLPDQPLDVVLPGGAAGAQSAAQYLRRVRICVASTNDPAFDFAAAAPMRVTSATALIARTGIN
ncbi:MAG: Verru_Chthon cassette protein B [Prosthecobacter sp.]